MQTKDIKKDELVRLVEDLRDFLRDMDESEVEEFHDFAIVMLREKGLELHQEVNYTIKVKCKFREEPTPGTVEGWLAQAFENQFSDEHCYFFGGEFDDVFNYEVTREAQ